MKRVGDKKAPALVFRGFKFPPDELAELEAEAEASRSPSTTAFVLKAIRNEIKKSRRRRQTGQLEP